MPVTTFKISRAGGGLAAVLAAALLAWVPASADQNDPILDGLIASLPGAGSLENAQTIMAQIQAVWNESGDSDTNLLLVEGTSAMESGDNSAALRSLNALVDSAPDFAEGWNRRAALHLQMTELDSAVADAERAIELAPNHFGAWSVLGDAKWQQGKTEEAIEAFRAAIITNPFLIRERTMFMILMEGDDGSDSG